MMRPSPAQPNHRRATPSLVAVVGFASVASVAFYAVPLWFAQRVDPAVTLAALMAVDAALVMMLARSRGSASMLAALVGLLVATALLRTTVFVALPFVLLYGGLAIGFAVSLRPGSTALITRIAVQRHGAALTERARRYFRGLTAAWAALFAALALGSAALALGASFEAWSLFTNLLSWPLIGAMFVGEYLLRRVVFRDLPADTPLDVIAATLSYRWWDQRNHD